MNDHELGTPRDVKRREQASGQPVTATADGANATFPPPCTPETLAQALALLRREKRLTLAQLSKKCGLSVSYLSDLERGRTLPSIDSLIAIAAATGQTLHLGMKEPGEQFVPLSPNETEMIYALRQGDYKRFILMADIIVNDMTHGE